jgi:hypothetical protein
MKMLSRKTVGGVLAAAVAVASLIVTPTSALAASNGQTSFAPSNANPASPRPFFVYTLNPGAVIHDTAVLENSTDKKAEFALYAADGTDVNGSFSLSGQSAKATDVGSWVRLVGNRVTVPAHGKKTVAVEVAVPSDATPGDHAGGVVALPMAVSPTGGGSYQLGARYGVGIRIYLRVAGPIHPQLTVTKMKVSAPSGLSGPLFGHDKATLTYTIENTGNVRLSPNASATISTRASSQKFPAATLGEMLPGTSVTKTVTADGLRWGSLLGTIRAKVVVSAPDSPNTVGTASTSTWPWLALLILLALVIGTILFVRWLRRRGGPARHRRGSPPPPEVSADELIGA